MILNRHSDLVASITSPPSPPRALSWSPWRHSLPPVSVPIVEVSLRGFPLGLLPFLSQRSSLAFPLFGTTPPFMKCSTPSSTKSYQKEASVLGICKSPFPGEQISKASQSSFKLSRFFCGPPPIALGQCCEQFDSRTEQYHVRTRTGST